MAIIGNNKIMLYQKSLKQLNTIFPKLSIKPPTKKALIRSLIQQLECPYLSNTDMQQLKNLETAPKILKKLSKLVEMWIQIVENNQRARRIQEGVGGGVNRDKNNNQRIQQVQYMLVQAQHVSGKEQFILFIKQQGQILYGTRAGGPSTKDYKQTYIPKQQQFYNTITLISQQQYFLSLEELLQKLGILQQLISHQLTNLDHLQQLNTMLDSQQLFKKKDNILNRVINYNLRRARQVAQQIEGQRRVLYYYEDEITFAIARCYYLIYLAEREIEERRDDEGYLEAVEGFVTERREWVFPKLYARKIVKPLIKLEQVRQESMAKPYPIQSVSQQEHAKMKEMINNIQGFLEKNGGVALNQGKFMQLYAEIENLLVEISKGIRINGQNAQYQESRKILVQCEKEVLGLFVNEADLKGKEKEKSSKSRKVLSVANSRLSNKSKALGDAKSNKNHLSNHNSIRNTHKTDKNGLKEPSSLIDQGLDIFIEPLPEAVKTKQHQQRVEALVANRQQYEKECKLYIQKIKPQFGEFLQDAENFSFKELNLLIEAGVASASTASQKQVLTLIGKNLIKPQITEQTLNKIFQPELRFNVLKVLSEKLIELGYKNTKVFDSPQFQKLPQNIKQFVQTRNTFLKVVNKQLDKIKQIANVISRLQIKKRYDICKYETFEIFLKILLAQKQARSYELSFKDQKKISRQTSFFVKNKIYGPFIFTLSQLLPNPYNEAKEIVPILDQLQFFSDFLHFTNEIIYNFIRDIQMDRQKDVQQSQKKQLARILGKWASDAIQKLQKKKQVFLYDTAETQLNKINQIISLCLNGKEVKIKDPTAIKIQQLLHSKK